MLRSFSANGLSGITLKKDNVVNTQPSKKNANKNQRLLHNCDFEKQKLLCKKYDSKFIPVLYTYTCTTTGMAGIRSVQAPRHKRHPPDEKNYRRPGQHYYTHITTGMASIPSLQGLGLPEGLRATEMLITYQTAYLKREFNLFLLTKARFLRVDMDSLYAYDIQ